MESMPGAADNKLSFEDIANLAREAFHFRDGTWTPIPELVMSSTWPRDLGYRFYDETGGDIPIMTIWEKEEGAGRAFLFSLFHQYGSTLVFVDDFPNEVRLLKEITGFLDVWKLQLMQQQTDHIIKDFKHKYHHFADSPCPICSSVFEWRNEIKNQAKEMGAVWPDEENNDYLPE